MYISGKFLTYGDDLSQAFEIRKEVFVKEQGIPEELVFDDLDQNAIHAIVYEEHKITKENGMGQMPKPVGSGRIIYDGSTCMIGRVAVLKDYRGKKYGDFLIKMMLQKAFMAGVKEVVVHSQTSAEGFYQKIGFKRVGENFMEAGIEHCEMKIEKKYVNRACKK